MTLPRDESLPLELRALLELNAPERLDLVRGTDDPSGLVSDLVEQSRAQVIDDLAEALRSTEVVVELADAVGGASLRARARRARAAALSYGNRFDEALALLDEAIALAGRAGDAVEQGRARMAAVHGLARLGRYDEAIRLGEEALATFRAADHEMLAAKASANLGETHRMRGDPGRALSCYEDARRTLGRDPVMAAPLESNQAFALLDLNRFAEAEQFFERALRTFERAGMRLGAAIVTGNLADLMCRQGRIERALMRYEQARRHFETDGAAGDLARIEAERAEALALAGVLDEAADAYESAIDRLVEHGLVEEAGRAGVGHGRVLTRLGRYDEARMTLGRAAADYERLEHAAGRGRARQAAGELAMAVGDLPTARADLESALEFLVDRPAEAALARLALAHARLAAGAIDDADAVLAPAMMVADDLDLAPLRADLLHARARIAAARGRGADALDDLRAAARQVERVRGSLQADRFRSGYAGSRTAIFEDLFAALIARAGADADAAAADEAFAVVEHAKGRSLLDLVSGAVDLRELATSGAADGAADEREAAIVRRLTELRRDLNGMYSRVADLPRTDVASWRGEVAERERELAAIESRLDASRGVGGLFAPPIDVAGVRAILPADTVLVEYFTAGGRLSALVVDGERVTVARDLASSDDLTEHVERSRFQVDRVLTYGDAARSDAALVDDARTEFIDLHRLVFAPLEAAVGGARRIVVAPHGPLHGVPFQALHDGTGYLVERAEVLQVPSASLLRHLAPAQRRGDRPALVMGVGDVAAPHVEDEARAVAAELGDARLYLGAAADVATFRRQARGASLVHLACHGRFSASSPLSSGLRLGDRWISVREIFETRLDGAVVVLSGCDTARAAVGAGDELTGLVRGFFVAGASALVLGLWSVHDESARAIMAMTYRLWHNGDGPDLGAALRRATLAAMARWPHPAAWAPFVLVARPGGGREDGQDLGAR